MPRLSLLALGSIALASILAPRLYGRQWSPDSGGTTPGDDGGMQRTGLARRDAGRSRDRAARLRSDDHGAPVEIDYTAMQMQADGSFPDVTSMVTWSAASLEKPFTGALHVGHRPRRPHLDHRVAQRTPRSHRPHAAPQPRHPRPGADRRADALRGATIRPTRSLDRLSGRRRDDPANLGTSSCTSCRTARRSFRLEVTTSAVVLRVLRLRRAVSGGCIFAPDHDTWAAISDAARRDGHLPPHRHGLSADRIGSAGVAHAAGRPGRHHGRRLLLNAAGGAIMRYEFGVPGAVEERFLGVAQTGAGTMCVGCHTLARRHAHRRRHRHPGRARSRSSTSRRAIASLRRPMTGGGFPQQPTSTVQFRQRAARRERRAA